MTYAASVPPDLQQNSITPAGMTPTVRAVRDLLSAAGEARRRGDRAVADMLEQDAALVLRAALQDAKAEARNDA